MRLGLIPVGCAGIIAGQLVIESVADLHAQGAGKGDRRRHVETVDGDPAAEHVTHDAAVIGRGKTSPLRKVIPRTVEVILGACASHRGLSLVVAIDRFPAFQHSQAKAARKRDFPQGRTQPPVPVLHVELTAHVVSIALGVQDCIRNTMASRIFAPPLCMEAQWAGRSFW